MEAGRKFKVEITQLKISKPLLKVFARNVNCQSAIFLQNLKKCYHDAPRNYKVELGELYIASISSTQFERCRVLQTDEVDKTALVLLIDCGYQGTIRYCQLRTVDAQKIKFLKPLSLEFVLANIQLNSNPNYGDGIARLHDMIVGKQVLLEVKENTKSDPLVDLLIDGSSLVHDLIPNDKELSHILEEVSLEEQISLVADKKRDRERRMQEQGCCPRTLIESPESKRKCFSAAFPSFIPLTGTLYDIRITAYENGPSMFFVQFTSQDDSFQKFQCDLQALKCDLEVLRSGSIGTKCIAVIDGQLHRAEILHNDSKVPNCEVTIRLLETGIKAIVAQSNLHAMPEQVAKVQPFATSFCLAGLEEHDGHHADDLSFIFHRLTNNKHLKLRLVTAASPRCELFSDNLNIADECSHWDPSELRYPLQQPLIGNTYKVEVSYVDSPKEFYVHVQDKDYYRYNILRDALNTFTSPQLRNPRVGSACVIKHFRSNVRGRIVRRISSEIYKVAFVDYGFTDDFVSPEIRIIDEDFVKLPPFAFKCCLKEASNFAVSDALARQFKDKIASQQIYQMTIWRQCGDFYIVELEEATSVDESINRSDWTEASSSFRSHFEKRRRLEQLEYNDNDISDGWTHSVIDITESPEGTLVGPQELPWEEHSAGVGFDSWLNPLTPMNKVIDLDESSHYSEYDTSSSTKMPQISPATSSSGFNSLPSDERSHQKIGVKITAVNGADDFTIQELGNADRYKNFCKEIQKLAKANQPLTKLDKGKWCLAYDIRDKLWKRATIVDVIVVNFTLIARCLDTGTIFHVNELSLLKSMSVNLRTKPFFGLRCSLPIRIPMQSREIAKRFLVNRTSEALTCQLLSEDDDGLHFVEIFVEKENIADFIVGKGCAVRQVVVPSGLAYISFVSSTNDFVIQMDTSTENMKAINEYTQRYLAVNKTEPTIGDLVLAFYPQENCFYRARLIGFEKGEKFRVYLIDHGHDAVVELIGEIDDPMIAEIPPIAFKASLALPRSSARIEKKFKDFADLGKTCFYVRTIKPGDEKAVVEILNESKMNVVDLLLE